MKLKELLNAFIPLVLCAILLFSYNRGVILHDEGHILHAAARVSEGEVIYRDFHFLYTPFSVYITALAFKLFSVSVHTARVLALVTAWLTAYLIYKLISSFKRIHPSLILIAIGIYIAWGPTHINFPYPVTYALLWSIVLLLSIYKALEQRKQYWWFISGASAILVFLSKQNFGIASLITLLFSFTILNTTSKRKYSPFFLAFGAIVTLATIYGAHLLMTNSANYFVYEALIFPVTHFVGKNIMTTPFIYPGVWYRQILRLLWYNSPFFVAVYGLWLTRKINIKIEKTKAQIIFFYIAIFYIVGIRPTTDYVHLTPLLSVIGIGIVTIIYFEKNKLLRVLFWLLGISLCLFGLVTTFWYQYYRWETPLIKQNLFLSSPQTNIFVDQKYYEIITSLSKTITKLTQNKYIFVYYDRPLLYLILNKQNPTKHIDTTPGLLTLENQYEIVSDLKRKEIDLVITHNILSNDPNLIEFYIRNNFKQSKTIYEYNVWTSK